MLGEVGVSRLRDAGCVYAEFRIEVGYKAQDL